MLIGFIVFPTNYWPVFGFLLIERIIFSMNGFLDGILINSFPLSSCTAMIIAMCNSSKNLGNSGVIQMWTVGYIGHNTASIIGFAIQAVVLLNIGNFIRWIEEGEVD